MTKRWLTVVGFAALLGALAVAGYWLLFSTFMIYDDEGYVLLSLKNYGIHGALYDEVYSQYGPFFYEVYDAVRRILGFTWTSTSGRIITLIHWLSASCLCAILVWRTIRSAWLSAFTLAVTFAFLWTMIREPSHPGGLITSMTAFAAVYGAELIRAQKWKTFGAVAGCVSAGLLMTKVNVGGLFACGTGLWLILHAVPQERVKAVLVASAVAVVLLPFALMRALIHQEWVSHFAVVFALSAVGVALALTARRSALDPTKGIPWFIGTAAACVVLIFSFALLSGSSFPGLLEGVLLGPLKHPIVYSFAFVWRPGSILVAGGSLAVTAYGLYGSHRGAAGFIRCVAGLRILIGLLFVGAVFAIVPISLPNFALSYGLALAPLMALGLSPRKGEDQSVTARGWLAVVFVFQSLHAYPIAGSQLNWGTFLWIPLMTLGVHEALSVFDSRDRIRANLTAASVAVLAGISCLMVVFQLGRVGHVNRTGGQPLSLSGAENMVGPDDIVFGMKSMSENAVVHSDMLFSLPGLFSFNLWTGLPTPTLSNVTHWFSILSIAQQKAIVHQLQASPRACVIVQDELLTGLADSKITPHGGLVNYLEQAFEPAFRIDGYAFWVHRGRKIAALSTARISLDSAGTSEIQVVAQSPAAAVEAIKVWEIKPTRALVTTLSAANAQAKITPLAESGTPVAPARDVTWPIKSAGIVQLTVNFAGTAGITPSPTLLVTLHDKAGHMIGAARALP